MADLSAPRKQRHTARRVWQRLVDERGASVAESTVRAYVGRVRRELESGRAVVTIPQLHPPGEEAEVDFGGVSVWLDGELTELSMFVMRLSHSGRAVHVCFPGEGQEAFLEGHTVALGRLGGVPRRVRYDNLKAAVTRVLAGRDRIESDRFTALRSHFGFDAFFCEPGIAGRARKGRRGGRGRSLPPAPPRAGPARREPGRAERAARGGRPRRRRAPHRRPARHRRSGGGGRATCASAPPRRTLRPHGRTAGEGRPQGAHLRARLALLGPRGLRGPDGGRPPGRRDRDRHRRGPVVARHERSAHKGSEVLVLDHYLEVLSRKPGALPGSSALAQARSGGGFTAAHERFWQRARRKLGDGAGTRALVEVLLLHRHLPAASVHAALDAVEQLGAADPALVAIEARRIADGRREAAVVERPALRHFERPAPSLAGYDALLAASTR